VSDVIRDWFDRNGFTVLSADHNPDDPQIQILVLHMAGLLGYVRPSDEWVDGTGEPLPDPLQDAAHQLVTAGFLPEFEEATR
jgi:hypothetical protein